jgi:hypothetical protein
LPPPAYKPQNYKAWERDFINFIYRIRDAGYHSQISNSDSSPEEPEVIWLQNQMARGAIRPSGIATQV